MGLPKLFEPKLTGGLGGLVRFRARVSGRQSWKVSVTDQAGLELAAGSGQGPTVDWTWDASLVTAAGIRWRIEVPGATPIAGTIGKTGAGGGPLAISGLSADPETISPNDDGAAESSTITYTTTAAATVTATLLDAVAGQVAELLPATSQAAGEHTLTFDGLGQPDGVYTVVITAVDTNGTSVAQQVQITITRTLGSASLAPAVFTPNGDGKGDELEVSFQLAVPATVKLRVLRDGTWVATPFAGPLPAGAQSLGWDGAKRVGAARDGSYVAVVEVTDTIGTSSLALPFLKDGHPPAIKLFARPARLWVSEAATVTVRVNGALRHLQVRGPGYLALTGISRVRTIVAVARDGAGNKAVLRRP